MAEKPPKNILQIFLNNNVNFVYIHAERHYEQDYEKFEPQNLNRAKVIQIFARYGILYANANNVVCNYFYEILFKRKIQYFTVLCNAMQISLGLCVIYIETLTLLPTQKYYTQKTFHFIHVPHGTWFKDSVDLVLVEVNEKGLRSLSLQTQTTLSST